MLVPLSLTLASDEEDKWPAIDAMLQILNERGWPKNYNIPAGMKNVDVRKLKICVRKLAANSSDCGVSECAAFPLQRATTVVKLASTENIF